MDITFDPARRDKTLTERGLDFADAIHVFEGIVYDYEDTRFAYPEVRMISMGSLEGRMIVLVWTPRGEARHIISMRKANDREQERYRRYLD